MNPVKRSNRFVLHRVGRTYALPFSRASLNMGWLSVFDLHQTFSPNTFHPSQTNSTLDKNVWSFSRELKLILNFEICSELKTIMQLNKSQCLQKRKKITCRCTNIKARKIQWKFKKAHSGTYKGSTVRFRPTFAFSDTSSHHGATNSKSHFKILWNMAWSPRSS